MLFRCYPLLLNFILMKLKVLISNRASFFAAIVAVTILPLLATDQAQPPGKSRYGDEKFAFMDVKKTMAVAAQITTAKYPDSDDVTVEKKIGRAT